MLELVALPCTPNPEAIRLKDEFLILLKRERERNRGRGERNWRREVDEEENDKMHEEAEPARVRRRGGEEEGALSE